MKNNNYLKSFFCSVYPIVSILLASLFMTVFAFEQQFSITASMRQSLSIYAYVVLGIFIISTLIYIFASLKKRQITFADSFAFALIFAGIAHVLFTEFFVKEYTLSTYVILSAFRVVGILYIILRICLFAKEKDKLVTAKNKFTEYYKAVLSKFSFPIILITAFVLTCLSYLVFASGFSIRFFSNNKALTLLASILLTIPMVAYVVKSCYSKKICLFDAVMISMLFVIVISLCQILVVNFSLKKIIFLAIAVVVYAIVLAIRIKTCNLDLNCEEKEEKPCYFGKLINKFNLIDCFALASFIVLVTLAVLKSGVLLNNIALVDGELKINSWFLVSAITSLSCACIILFSLFTTIINIGRKEVGAGDFTLFTLLSTGILGFAIYPFYQVEILLYALIGLIALSLIFLLIRISATKCKK